jgi:protein-S-isoprenylcysteine O-methyltransferase Ste14
MVLQVLGVIVFLAATVLERAALRTNPTPEEAERASRICQAAFYGGLIAPYVLGLIVPGAAALDGLAHVPVFPLSLPARLAIAAVLLVPSGYFSFVSNKGLASKGKGAPAFKLTRGVVTDGVFGRVRNPMALGFYLGCLGFAFLFGSLYLLIYGLVLIAVHIFYLKVFEERELSVRYGESYDVYRTKTPFLIPRLRGGPTTGSS